MHIDDYAVLRIHGLSAAGRHFEQCFATHDLPLLGVDDLVFLGAVSALHLYVGSDFEQGEFRIVSSVYQQSNFLAAPINPIEIEVFDAFVLDARFFRYFNGKGFIVEVLFLTRLDVRLLGFAVFAAFGLAGFSSLHRFA